jgi:hypothetical protein
MKSILLISCAIFLAGCSTFVPVERKFPPANLEINSACPELQTVPVDNSELSVLLDAMSENYSRYHACRLKVEGWIIWYEQQKFIFESTNK